MAKFVQLLFLCFYLHMGTAQFGVGNFIQDIFQSVHKSLGLTGNGGGFFGNPTDLGEQINQQVHNALRGTENLGSMITANIQKQLAPLHNLGFNIQNSIQQSLQPVYALKIKNDMSTGVGGTTIATYYGKIPRSFIIQDGMRSVCVGTINRDQCFGNLEPFEIVNDQDFCYANSYANVNNRICLSSGPLNVMVLNNHLSCESSDGSPTVALNMRQYRELCGNRMPWQAVFTYYANPNDPRAIPIPNPNPYVTCRNNEPGVCEFEGTKQSGGGSSGTMFSSGGGMSFNYFN